VGFRTLVRDCGTSDSRLRVSPDAAGRELRQAQLNRLDLFQLVQAGSDGTAAGGVAEEFARRRTAMQQWRERPRDRDASGAQIAL